MILHSTCICIDITLLRAVADDLLKCEKIEKWCLLKLIGRKGFMKGSHCSKLLTNHLGLRIISFTNLQILKKWRKKVMGIVQTFKNLISL